jgi:cellulose synthase/poly-beta-1,6-N-acetylglucosamine synthase-like glycosyltransferase
MTMGDSQLLLQLLFWGSWALVFYTYFLFPVLLAILARVTRRSSGDVEPREVDDASLPRVAMVVAAFNEAKVLEAKLRNTWEIDYPGDRFEVVIGSDGSEDGTHEILARCDDPRLRALPFQVRRGKISVLNDLLKEVDADIVVMSDANTMFAPDAIRKLVRHFQDPAVGCVSGELTIEHNGGVSGEGLYWKYECWIKRNESRLGFLMGCNGGIFALRRHLYRPLPASTIVEDFVLTMRVLEQGFVVRFEPEARAVEPPCPSARAEMVRKIRIGAGGFQSLGLIGSLLHPRHGMLSFAFWGHKVIRWFVPVFLVAGLLANVALFDQDLYRLLLCGQVAGLGIARLAYHQQGSLALPRWLRPISYFYLMNFALLCGLVRFLFRTQRVTWDRAAS